MACWWQEKKYRSLVESVLQQINASITPAGQELTPLDVQYQNYVRAMEMIVNAFPDHPEITEKFDQIFNRSLLEAIQFPQITASNVSALSEAFDVLFNQPSHRMAVYGSLAPGKDNHHNIEHIQGEWYPGVVYGQLQNTGWGSEMGFPALNWIPNTDPVEVQVLKSSELPDHWPRLDEFEGDQYKRIYIPVELDNQSVEIANIYVAVEI